MPEQDDASIAEEEAVRLLGAERAKSEMAMLLAEAVTAEGFRVWARQAVWLTPVGDWLWRPWHAKLWWLGVIVWNGMTLLPREWRLYDAIEDAPFLLYNMFMIFTPLVVLGAIRLLRANHSGTILWKPPVAAPQSDMALAAHAQTILSIQGRTVNDPILARQLIFGR